MSIFRPLTKRPSQLSILTRNTAQEPTKIQIVQHNYSRPAPAKMVNLFEKPRIMPEVEDVTIGRNDIDGIRRAVSPDFSEAFEIALPTCGISPKSDVELFGQRWSNACGKSSYVRFGRRQWREPIQAHRQCGCARHGARASMV